MPTEGPQVVADSTGLNPITQPQQQHIGADFPHRPSRDDRDRREERPIRGSGQDYDRHRPHDKHKSEHERTDLAQELDRLTRDISFQELRMWVATVWQHSHAKDYIG